MKVIVDLAGGLGNQLFCYCFGYAVSKKTNSKFVLDTSMQDCGIARELELLNFNVDYSDRISYVYKKGLVDRMFFNKVRKIKSIGIKTRIYQEKEPTKFEPEAFEISTDTYFKGNWQTEKYFSEYRNELLKMLVPKYERTQSVNGLVDEMQKCNSVAVHVRRGDYLQIGCQLSMDFYDKAILKFQELNQRKNTVFYIFSDDIDFVKQYFGKYEKKIELHYPQYESDNKTLDDLFLMSHCKHIIMANSSFSWWAAWLNQNENKIVICPELGMWSGDFYPEKWNKIICE
ncbi:Glycosyl transferase family 11 [uncultured Blautia sp.]|nr:alpha-1,2-fucosyltransferase [uncultured Blautia sp.]SCH90667.1 Glycosyl transferase family 11 [uncultured Blautia sp.]